MNKRLIVSGSLAVLAVGYGAAADYLGAKEILSRLAPKAEQGEKAADSGTQRETWERQLAEFQNALPGLSPEQAAKQWLTLADIAMKLRTQPDDFSGFGGEASSWQKLFAVLPPPAAWDALAAAISARPLDGEKGPLNASLRVLATALRGDRAGLSGALSAVEKQMNVGQPQESMADMLLAGLRAWMQETDDDPQSKIEQFKRSLDTLEKPGMTRQLEVPDVVTLVDAATAEALLKRALLLPKGTPLQIPVGSATRALAVKLATEQVDQLKMARWELVQDVGPATIALYEALSRRFGDSKTDPENPGDESEAEATRRYLFSLIAAGRKSDAVKVARGFAGTARPENSIFGYHDAETLIRAGLVKQTQAFLKELLAAEPELPFWDDFIRVSARAGASDVALAFLREVAAKPLSEAAQQKVRSHLWSALLAADQVDEGVALMRELLATYVAASSKPPEQPQFRARRVMITTDDHPAIQAVQLGLRLAELGRLLAKPEWVAEGFQAGAQALRLSKFRDSYLLDSLADRLFKAGRGPDAEKLLLDAQLATRQTAGSGYGGLGNQTLSSLLRLYEDAGRHTDVLTLLAEGKEWGVGDVSELELPFGGHERPIGYTVARSLAATGQKEEARRVLTWTLEQSGGYDPAYALLLEFGGGDVVAELDRLAARDRFEERPLIWKAKVLLERGETDAAEKTIRAAIAIDPSDGEEGKGDRMRAYAVLGDVLEKKGDDAQAKIMRGAVAAIRMSEDADDWWEAGLLSRAVQKYEEALGRFADAYCIQSRLALRYAELGEHAKAEEHYRRAYELMPDSFGRVESHCFGCEGAFNGERAQSVAEGVFTQLAQKMPTKPQVFYLLGYLREQQGRYAEAAEQYRKATQLDPDYLNAWRHLSGLATKVALSRADREGATLAVLRLDPLGRHGGSGSFYYRQSEDETLTGMTDFRALWPLLEMRVNLQANTRRAVFTLPASRAELERQRKEAEETQRKGGMPRYYPTMGRDFSPPKSAGELLAHHPLFFNLLRVMQALTNG